MSFEDFKRKKSSTSFWNKYKKLEAEIKSFIFSNFKAIERVHKNRDVEFSVLLEIEALDEIMKLSGCSAEELNAGYSWFLGKVYAGKPKVSNEKVGANAPLFPVEVEQKQTQENFSSSLRSDSKVSPSLRSGNEFAGTEVANTEVKGSNYPFEPFSLAEAKVKSFIETIDEMLDNVDYKRHWDFLTEMKASVIRNGGYSERQEEIVFNIENPKTQRWAEAEEDFYEFSSEGIAESSRLSKYREDCYQDSDDEVIKLGYVDVLDNNGVAYRERISKLRDNYESLADELSLED